MSYIIALHCAVFQIDLKQLFTIGFYDAWCIRICPITSMVTNRFSVLFESVIIRLIKIIYILSVSARSWGQCPDLVDLYRLPAALRQYITNASSNRSPIYTFSPAVPGRHANGQFLCNISFAMLEKEFLRSNSKLRELECNIEHWIFYCFFVLKRLIYSSQWSLYFYF